MKIRNITFLLTIFMASIAAMSAQDAVFNVATYNIRQLNDGDTRAGNGWQQRAPIIAQLALFHDFDIFGTQEGFKQQLDDLKAAMPGYEYIGRGRDDGKDAGEHSAIFYRTDLFSLLDSGDFWLSETPDRPGLGWDAACVRICTWGRFLHKPSGKQFLFYNLHMDHVGTTARIESAKLIKQKIHDLGRDLPVFVTGDFNVDQFSPSYATITEGNTLVDAHSAASQVYELNGTFNNYSTDGYTTSRIDHIFVSPNIKVEKYGILTDTYRTPASTADTQDAPNAPSEIGITTVIPRTPTDHVPVKTRIHLP